jgi:hypothetical protein
MKTSLYVKAITSTLLRESATPQNEFYVPVISRETAVS